MLEPDHHDPLIENLRRFRMDRCLCIMAAQLYRVAGQQDRAAAQLRLAATFDEPIATMRAALPSWRQR
jgi:protein involved in temperature-dependent protein secretion